nr:immunoglobulin heavy chain junction region [Macaca mulatta]
CASGGNSMFDHW